MKLPKSFHKAISDYAGKKVTFGVRPEDFYDKQFTPEATAENTIKTKVEVIEPLGEEVLFYLVSGKHQIVAKLDRAVTRVKVGDELDVVLEMPKTHVFDLENMNTLV